MNEHHTPTAFLASLSSRDFDRLAECLAPSVQARLFLPRGPELRTGRDDITRRFEGWFASTSDFEVLETGDEQIARRHRLNWRFSLSRDGVTREVIEQVAFVDVTPEGISQIDLLCSGFLPTAQHLVS
jgi:hypothetical protein